MSTQMTQFCCFLMAALGFPCGSAGKECTCNAGDLCSIPGLGRSPGEGKGYPLQYSGLENSMDYIVCGVTKSQTQLSNSHFNGCIIFHCVYICAPSSLSIPLLMDVSHCLWMAQQTCVHQTLTLLSSYECRTLNYLTSL